MTIDLIRRHFPEFSSWKYPGEPNSHVYTWLDSFTKPGYGTLPLNRLRRAKRPILMTHLWPEMKARLATEQPALHDWLIQSSGIIHVVRNPRHAISSAWPIESYRMERGLQDVVSLEHYIEISARRWIRDISLMRGAPHLLMRYEDIKEDPLGALKRIGSLLNANLSLRQPVFAPVYRSLTEARIARLHKIRPASTRAMASKAVRRKYSFVWTPLLNSILYDIAKREIIAFNYQE